MEENNGMQEKQYVFGNTDNTGTGYESKVNSGLDQDTFGNETNVQREQKTTVHTPEWNADTYTSPGQADYYTQTAVPAQEKKKGKALEICALIFGIISLCGCCYGLFGLVGFVLGIVAIVTGRKSGLSIAGLVLSILGIGTAVMWSIFNFSPAGEQWREELVKSFQEGFEKGYNSTYDEGIDSTDEEQEETDANVDSADSSGLSDQVLGTVMINGKEITIPCKVSEARYDFELSTYSENGLETGLEAYDSDIIHLLSDGSETGVRFMVSNPKDTAVADINDAYVVGVWMNDNGYANADAKFFKDITVGMGKEDLEKVLGDESYDKNEEEDYEYYTVKSGEYGEFNLSIYVREGKVSEVEIDYYGDCE